MSSIHGSPSKSKSKEDDYWQPGWWELQSFAECDERPLSWSASSIIFTAHPTKPFVLGRLFTTSKEFIIPSPTPVTAPSAMFEPPSVITASPDDRSLFAYFPCRDGTGLACFWSRGLEVDSWGIKEYFTFPRGSDVITSAWLGGPRTWVTDPNGRGIRLPLQGPPTPCTLPTFMVVTRNLEVILYYIRNGSHKFMVLSCSLTQPDQLHEKEAHGPSETPTAPGGAKICVRAAIGLSYNEPSILIATHSRTIAPPLDTSSFNVDMPFALEVAHQNQPTESFRADDWNNWAEEPMIELCEVRVGFDEAVMSLSTNPLPAIYCPTEHLNKMILVPQRPSSESKGALYLAMSFLDFGSYTSPPKSELKLYSLFKNPTPLNNSRPNWLSRLDTTRSFTSEILTFISRHVTGFPTDSLLVGTLNTSANVSRNHRKSKETSIGSIHVLQMPSLENDNHWRTVPVLSSSSENILPDLLLSVALSPNGALLCTASPPLYSPSKISVHPLPRRYSGEPMGPPSTGSKAHTPIPPDTYILVSAIKTPKSVADIVHQLSLSSSPLSQVEDVLCCTLSLLEQHAGKIWSYWLNDLVGLVLEVYRSRSRRTDNPVLKEQITVRYQTARDLCSIIACHSAFEDCKDGDLYDIEAVWPLIGLSTWFLEFSEKILRECVLLHNAGEDGVPAQPSMSVDEDDLFGSSTSLSSKAAHAVSSILLHLVHPYALESFRATLGDVRRFHDQLNASSSGSERIQIAKSVFLDTVACSGIKLKELDAVLVAVAEGVKSVDRMDLKRSLILCQPLPSLLPLLHKIAQTISTSRAIDKPLLFIKPDEIVTGVPGPHFFDRDSDVQRMKDSERDIVSKTSMLHREHARMCLRCGGRSENLQSAMMHAKVASLRWNAWYRNWAVKCVCGGQWTSDRTQTYV